MRGDISLDHLRTEAAYNLISLYEDGDEDSMETDLPFQYTYNIDCHYYLVDAMHRVRFHIST